MFEINKSNILQQVQAEKFKSLIQPEKLKSLVHGTLGTNPAVRKIQITVVAVLLVCTAVCNVAVATAGTDADPLITQSYLELVLTPQLLDEAQATVNKQADALTDEMDDQIAVAQAEISDEIRQAAAEIVSDPDFAQTVVEAGGESMAGWEIINLNAGDTIELPAGSEVILRSGAATCTVELIDLNTLLSLPEGSPLTANHYYKAQTSGGTLQATIASMVMAYGVIEVE